MTEGDLIRERFQKFLQEHAQPATKEYSKNRLSPEVLLTPDDQKELTEWFNRKDDLADPQLKEVLLREYDQSCQQMRHWDNIQWVLNSLFLGIGLGILGFAYQNMRQSSNGFSLIAFGVVFLWVWYLGVYLGFRKRALRTLTFVLLLEHILDLKSQSYSLSGSWYVTPVISRIKRLNLAHVMFAFVLLITLLIIRYYTSLI